MHCAFVVPRYGTEVVGGAELGTRMLAERLVAMRGWTVEVFTTCALDHMTWADSYPPGSVIVNGVSVHRFTSLEGRASDFDSYSVPILGSPASASAKTQDEWIYKQGPVCPDVIDAAEASSASVVGFYPYLYYPTVLGIPRLGKRSVMHPAAHDEAPIRLPIFKDVFESTAGFAFHTHGERKFVHKMFAVAQRPQLMVGLGIETGTSDPEEASRALGFDVGIGTSVRSTGRPYLCSLGRVDDMKGSRMLCELFLDYKKKYPSHLALALVGPVVSEMPEHPDIIVTGKVSEGAKWGILENALCLVSPSPHESFSLVVLEAWSAGIPVVVNGACDATREHCELSGGGRWFGGPGSVDATRDFEDAIHAIETESDTHRSVMVNAGRHYAESNFSWPAVIDRYSTFLEKMAERAAS